MESLLNSLARKLDPSIDKRSRVEQAGALMEMAGLLWTFPFALGGVIWLVAATEWLLIQQTWPVLLLLLALHVLFSRLSFSFQRQSGKGVYTIVSGSFVTLVSWSAALIFGPTGLWIAILNSATYEAWQWRQQWGYRRRVNLLFNFILNIAIETFAPLLALWVYRRLGGVYPLPGLGGPDIWPALAATVILALIPFFLVLLPLFLNIWQSTAWRDFFRLLLFANGFGLATLPFAVLAAGLYTQLGLPVYLFLLAGGALTNLLAYRFSQILNSLQERAVELAVLEQLGRELIAAPPDLSTLPQLLDEHAPRLNGGGPMAIWLIERAMVYRFNESGIIHLDEAREKLQTRFQQMPGFTGFSEPNKEGVLTLLPIRGDQYRLIGGIATWSGQQRQERLPALQSLSGQIASAVHRADAYEQMITSEKMARELEIAGKIQATFLPTSRPRLPGWDVAAALIPARQTSGDFYDFVYLENGRLGLVVADVADKGTGAALYMALSRTLLRTYAMQFPDDPARALQATNERILTDTESEQFVTVFYGVLDPVGGRLLYANAGHNPALVVGNQVTLLGNTGIPLGMFPEQSWQNKQVYLAPGESLLLYSDGIPEAMNGMGGEFGDERLQQVAAAYQGQSAAAIQEAIHHAVQTFVADAPQADDITLLVLVRHQVNEEGA